MPVTLPKPSKRRCTAVRRDGTPCRGWAVRGSEPPRCGSHGGGLGVPGARAGNQNALKHGFYSRVLQPGELADLVAFADDLTLDDEIAMSRVALRRILPRLDAGELEVGDLTDLAGLVFAGSRTIARLLRDQRALSGESADGLAGALGVALDEIGTQWGLDL